MFTKNVFLLLTNTAVTLIRLESEHVRTTDNMEMFYLSGNQILCYYFVIICLTKNFAIMLRF